MKDPRNEKSRPVIPCTECEGTGYQKMECIYCGYDLSNDFNLNPNSVLHYSSDDECPSCRHRDCLAVCTICNGEGTREINDDEYETWKVEQKYGHNEKL